MFAIRGQYPHTGCECQKLEAGSDRLPAFEAVEHIRKLRLVDDLALARLPGNVWDDRRRLSLSGSADRLMMDARIATVRARRHSAMPTRRGSHGKLRGRRSGVAFVGLPGAACGDEFREAGDGGDEFAALDGLR